MRKVTRGLLEAIQHITESKELNTILEREGELFDIEPLDFLEYIKGIGDRVIPYVYREEFFTLEKETKDWLYMKESLSIEMSRELIMELEDYFMKKLNEAEKQGKYLQYKDCLKVVREMLKTYSESYLVEREMFEKYFTGVAYDGLAREVQIEYVAVFLAHKKGKGFRLKDLKDVTWVRVKMSEGLLDAIRNLCVNTHNYISMEAHNIINSNYSTEIYNVKYEVFNEFFAGILPELLPDEYNTEFMDIIKYLGKFHEYNVIGAIPMTIFDKTETEVESILLEIKELRAKKNADYGDAWRKMRPIGITDIIAVKIDRIKSFEDKGSLNNESVEDSLKDIINYCLFRLIKGREL